jgi:hypothetical protein
MYRVYNINVGNYISIQMFDCNASGNRDRGTGRSKVLGRAQGKACFGCKLY